MSEVIGLEFDLSSEAGRRALVALRDSLNEVNRALEGGKSAGKSYQDGMIGAEDATKKQGETSLQAASSTDTLKASNLALHPAVVGVTAVVGALTVGLGAAVAMLMKSIEAWGEQAVVNQKVITSLQNLGLSGADAKDELAALSAVAGEMANQTLYGDEAILEAVASLNQWRNSAASAEEVQSELNVALGIAQTLNMDTAAAAKEYARAAGGNVGAAEKLLGLTEAQKKSLTELKDVNERGILIQEMLTERYAGAAQAVDPLQLATSRLSDAQGDLWQAIGQGVATSGALEPVLDTLSGVLREVEGYFINNQEAVRGFVFRGVNVAIDGLDSLISTIQFLSPAIIGLATYLELSKNWFGLVFDAVGLVGRGLYSLGAQYISFVTGRLEAMLGAFASVADFVDSDFSAMLRNAAASMGEFSEKAQGVAGESFEQMKADTLAAGGNIDAMVESLAKAPERLAALNSGIEEMRARVQVLREAMANAEDADPNASDGGSKVISNKREELELAEKSLKALEDESAALEMRDEIARRKLAILMEEDEMRRAQFEFELQLFELDQQKLTTEEILLGSMQAKFDLQAKILGIEERRAAEAKRLADMQAKVAADQAKAQEALKKQADATAKAQLSMWVEIGDLAFGAFEGAIKSAGALATIRAIMYAAEAIGLFATGNVPGAIASGKAAVQHGVAAVMAGSSAPSTGAAGAGAGGLTASTGGGGGAGSAREIGRTIAEEMNRQSESLQNITINNDWRGATVLEETPSLERRLVQAMQRGLRVDGIRLGAT